MIKKKEISTKAPIDDVAVNRVEKQRLLLSDHYATMTGDLFFTMNLITFVFDLSQGKINI
jgi:hypothetical protein